MDSIKHVPRAYQEELFIEAQRTNVIATLDTGSGKTFIAALLIKWILSLPSSNGKKVVFLVPKVPLVDQQRDFLISQTPLEVRGYKGAMGVESWDISRWQREFAETDVLVMTAQIFKNILTHAFWSLDKISLLIFDECHHARNNHPYNMIMHDHYSMCNVKPKIFGMTASPIWNPKNPSSSLQTLQFNLFSKVIAVRKHADDLRSHSHKPIETIHYYPVPPLEYPDYLCPSFWQQLSTDKLINVLGISIDSLRNRFEATLRSLGPAGADYYLTQIISSRMKNRIRLDHERSLRMSGVTVLETEHSTDTAVIDSPPATTPIREQPKKSKQVKLEKLRLILSEFSDHLSSYLDIPFAWLSPKLLAVLEVLRKYKSPKFHAIIFVEQRQVASTLAWLLGRISETKDWIKCAELMGHGDADFKDESTAGMGLKAQREIVQSFKSGKLNLLIATSVAEEGLDFPACELVVRFDQLQHLVGYVQSRGRARHHASNFVIMIEEDDKLALDRYLRFKAAEPVLKKVYESTHDLPAPMEEVQAEEQDDPSDLREREVHVVSSTGATLTYSSSVTLLDHLCALIPRDRYTSDVKPKYIGDFECTLKLPSALPLAKELLTVKGMPKKSKKEAKRAVAFKAVQQLQLLGVFDEYLSPAASTKGDSITDADGRPIARVEETPEIMTVMVASPWQLGSPWYCQYLFVNGIRVAGVISGAILPNVDFTVEGTFVKLSDAFRIEEISTSTLDLLARFTKLGIWWCVTPSPVVNTPCCFLVPLNADGLPDWTAMERAVENELGSYDWSTITDQSEGGLMLMNGKRYGWPLLLQKFRHDLSLDMKPELDDVNAKFNTYTEYFEATYPSRSRKPGYEPIRPEGRILEVTNMSRRVSPVYSRETQHSGVEESKPSRVYLLPESYCKWVAMSMDIVQAFLVFTPLCQCVTDVYRCQAIQESLKLPPITDALTMEALTLPCALAGFSNQRFETLGDSVLKVAVVTYLYNQFPHKHEGQLDRIKVNCVSNRVLLARAREKGLERFLTSEARFTRAWQYTFDAELSDAGSCRGILRRFPRRSLQDCMEALLGASFICGGIDMALQTGTALGLCFGGASPWPERYKNEREFPSSPMLRHLQETLGYTFQDGQLLLEAVTHPSFFDMNGGSSYQRLEFLGDAFIDLVVMAHLFRKYPKATSGCLSWARCNTICNTTLAMIGVKQLSLHKFILANNVELRKEVTAWSEKLLNANYQDIIFNVWRYSPPKALGDVFESVMGAIFVDSGFNYQLVSKIVESVMAEVLEIASPDIPKDPVSRFMEWVSKAGCRKARFKRVQSNSFVERKDGIIILVHDQVIVGPVAAENLSLAKGRASDDAQVTLMDQSSDLCLSKICDCMAIEEEPSSPARDIRQKDLDDETEEGFANLGRIRLDEIHRDMSPGLPDLLDEEEDELDSQEVEALLADESMSDSSSMYDYDLSDEDMDCSP